MLAVLAILLYGCLPSLATQSSIPPNPSSNISSTSSAVDKCTEDPAASKALQRVPRAVIPGNPGDYTSVLSLDDLVAISNIIVVGTITPTYELLTYSTYPLPPTSSVNPVLAVTRIYTVEVEQILKGVIPTPLKLNNVEGTVVENPEPDRLPTQIAAAFATPQIDQRFVQWQTQTRYLLFLRPSFRLPGMVGCYFTTSDNPGSFILGTDGQIQVGPPGIIASSFVVPSSSPDLIKQVAQAVEKQKEPKRP